MTFGDMQKINKAIAAAAAEWRGPEAQLADAVRAMQESLRPQFSAVAAIAESLRSIQQDRAAALRSIVQQVDFGRNLAAQVAEALRPMRNLSKVVAESMRPIQEIAQARQTLLEACLRPPQEAARLRKQVLDQVMRPLQDMQRTQQTMIAEVVRPIREAAFLRQNLLRDILKPLREDLAQLAASLEGYSPNIEVNGETLSIDGQAYGPEDISRIEQEFLYDQAGVLVKSPAQVTWERIPAATRWLVQVILSTLIAIILQCLFFGLPNRPPAQVVHERKSLLRQVKQQVAASQQPAVMPPFVNTERLDVRIRPRRRSKAIAVLSYPKEVSIIRFRRKKRWALIQWQDGSGNTQQGWVMARYLFRAPSTPGRGND